eukprot:CAMPEP_0183711912 /NCGR_PEP_ID=MMETSP0737-20130205/7248_1 /TAXON_ID=385413 /ORGANISM="Thalassiosira miniscula, Strain CCMP1093" /LENGTH=153 /DNA_ID=CAMNT_0025940483 /DNA_START=236 /DNA_END=697 /DNA_ORIENTATION=-
MARGCILAPILLFARLVFGASSPISSTQHCNDNGGTELTKYSSDGGRYVLCVFDDGSACDTWEFYGGSCQKGSIPIFSEYCDATGGQFEQRSVNFGGSSAAGSAAPPVDEDYDACFFENGSHCEEFSYYHEEWCPGYRIEGKGIGTNYILQEK